MRRVFPIAFLLMASSGCGNPRTAPATQPRPAAPDVLSDDDRAIMQLVARSLIDDAEFRPNSPQGTFDSIVVARDSRTLSDQLGPGCIQQIVGATQYQYIAPDVVISITNRNQKSVPLDGLAGGKPEILIDAENL